MVISRKLLIVLMASCVALALTACGGNGGSQDNNSDNGPLNYVVVYSQHANSKASVEGLEDSLARGISNRSKLECVRLDGEPVKVASKGGEGDSQFSENETRRQAEVRSYLEEFAGVTAEEPEVDILGSVKMAGSALPVKDDSSKNVVIIVAPWPSTTGAIDFTQIELGSDDLNDYANYIEESGQLPDLSNIDRIVWLGFDDVDGPQNGFSSNETIKSSVKDFYTNVFAKAGVGEVVFSSDTTSGGSGQEQASDLPAVSVVEVPDPPKYKKGDAPIFTEDDLDLQFVPDTSDLKDDSYKNNSHLQVIADSVKAGETLIIEGYTANEASAKDANTLRQERAEKVKDILVSDFGCPEDKITAKAGEGFPYGEGTPGEDEELDQKNRCVKFTFE